MYLNQSALVSKGRDGGSGYNGYLHVTFIGDRTVNSGITLYNHFRPKTQIATGGVGYAATGSVLVPSSAYREATQLKVIVSRSSGSNSGNLHIAINKDSPVIAYVK